MKNKTDYWMIFKEYLIILAGSFVYAFGFDWMFLPNDIATGGFTGLSQIIHYFIPVIPIGTLAIILNIPLFIVGIKKQGIHLLMSSLFSMVTGSVFIDILPQFITFHSLDDQLLSSIMGGILIGFSSGITLWAGATTGGTELLARLLKYKFKHISIGKIILFADLVVIAIYTLVYGDIKRALYAGVAMYVSSIAVDAVIYGRRTAKVACIICDKSEEIKKILLDMNLGVTEIQSRGGFSGDSKEILICAFKPSRISALKMAVTKSDPNAFVIVCEAQEVFGEGFEKCEMDNL